MGRGIAILLVALMLIRGFSLLIEGLPYLFDHYHSHAHHLHVEHQEELSFLAFFFQHYGGLRKHHNDVGGDHAGMSFSTAGKISVDFDFVPLKLSSVCHPRWVWGAGAGERFSWNSLYSHLYLQEIFHPPLA